MAAVLYAPGRVGRSQETDELQQLAERLDQFERRFLGHLREDLVAAEARQVLARTDEVAARLTQALVAAQRLSDALEHPSEEHEGSALEALRALHRELIRSLTYAALGTVALVLVTFAFVVLR